MKNYLIICILYHVILLTVSDNNWNCSIPKSEAVSLFKRKVLVNKYPNFDIDPYTNQTKESWANINKTLSNQNIVCAIKYTDEENLKYEIKNFENSSLALKNNFTITHQGRCGACSTLNDLAIYLSVNLTAPTRQCGMIAAFSESSGLKCLLDIGFSEQCAQIWLFNTKNTRKNCFTVCILAWILDEPYTKPDGTLNDCLQCDEDKSGAIFKYFSGRTRRNSGIRSEIDRPTDQIYNVTHCYY